MCLLCNWTGMQEGPVLECRPRDSGETTAALPCGWEDWAWAPRGSWICFGTRPGHCLTGDLGVLSSLRGWKWCISEDEVWLHRRVWAVRGHGAVSSSPIYR